MSVELIHSPPETITLDGYAASHRAMREMKSDGLLPSNTKVRSSKRRNYLVEQDHRNTKSRMNVTFGFKWIGNAVTTISGIELTHRIRKDQLDLSTLALNDTAAPSIWNAGRNVSATLAICTATSLSAQMTHANHQDGGGRDTEDWQQLQGGRQPQSVCQCARHNGSRGHPENVEGQGERRHGSTMNCLGRQIRDHRAGRSHHASAKEHRQCDKSELN
jgi:hypothetical protein